MKRILVLIKCRCCGEREVWTDSKEDIANLMRGHSAFGLRQLEEKEFDDTGTEVSS